MEPQVASEAVGLVVEEAAARVLATMDREVADDQRFGAPLPNSSRQEAVVVRHRTRHIRAAPVEVQRVELAPLNIAPIPTVKGELSRREVRPERRVTPQLGTRDLSMLVVPVVTRVRTTVAAEVEADTTAEAVVDRLDQVAEVQAMFRPAEARVREAARQLPIPPIATTRVAPDKAGLRQARAIRVGW